MDTFGKAREAEYRGVPLTDEERQARHFEQYGTTEFIPRGTGLKFQSIGMLQQLGTDPSTVSRSDIAGLIAGGLAGWYIAHRWPNAIVKYIGIVVGDELGILIARMTRK